MSVKQRSFSGTTSDWRGRNAVFCCKGSTCLPLFPLLLRLSHLYRYAPPLRPHSLAPNISSTCLKVQRDRQWSAGSVQLGPNANANPPQSVRSRLPAQRHLFPQQAPPPTSAPLPIVPDPSPDIGPLVFLTPQVPPAKRISPAGSLPTPPPARRAYNRTQNTIQINAVSATSPTARKRATASVMGLYIVPKMLACQLNSGWRRCGGRGQITNRWMSLS